MKYDELMELAEQDVEYQGCLKVLKESEPLYLAVRDSLPEGQRLIVETYLGICEELDHFLLLLALKETEKMGTP